MDYETVLTQVLAFLQQEQRVAYRVLKRRFQLDDELLEDLKADVIYAKQLAVDEDGRVLVWTGAMSSAPRTAAPVPPPAMADIAPTQGEASPGAPRMPDAERRQLTVLFCDLVDSTALASQLDPEDLREVVRAYQETCATVIARYEGHIAQYLGDGLLVYFGYPLAHDDDAQRAVRAGLGSIEALGHLNTRLGQERGVRLAVRLGIHTGLVVVGAIGSGGRQEHLALGETPNIAARLQGLAAPDTLVISEATAHLIQGYFVCQALGAPALKGLPQPRQVYRVLHESGAQTQFDLVPPHGLTPLVGRDEEVGLLQRCWDQAQGGLGQVVLLSGEAGIGKSRLVEVLKEHVVAEPQTWLTLCQCSPYYQHTALYPMIDLLERVVLRFERGESPQQKLSKLEGFLVQYGLSLAEAVPLFAAVLSLPLTADYAPLTVSPAQQKQQTLQALLTILLRIAAQQPVLFIMEDLHWVDPSTLEFLSLLVDQGPTARILALWTFRPDFRPPWTGRAHLTQVTLNRLPRRQAAEMISQVVHGKALPAEVVEQVVAKTDGVPLFVEELTKMVLESGLLQERAERYELTEPLPPLAIPTTLHDSLMARLDRLATVKVLAQLGATLGREFSYALLQAVSPWDEGTLQHGLHQLVQAEFLYQQGLPPQAMYRFKHALIQEAAYQSLLRSTRQQYHQRIAQVLEAQFPNLCETQPELLAHHYTEASLIEQALPCWQWAGERALERSAMLEAVAHLTKALEVLDTLPDTPERAQQELDLQIALGPALISTTGHTAEAERVYTRARALCQQVGDPSQLFPVLWGLRYVQQVRGQSQQAYEVGKELLDVAQQLDDPVLFVEAHRAQGNVAFWRGEFRVAYGHVQQALTQYDPQQMRDHVVRYGQNPGVFCRLFGAVALWLLGYPDQARQWIAAALTHAQELGHAFTQQQALCFSALLHLLRREVAEARAQAEAQRALCTAQGFRMYLAWGTIQWGAALVAQGTWAEGLAQMRQGLAAYRSSGPFPWLLFLGLLAEACGRAGQVEEGLRALHEALEALQTTEERMYEAELHRLRGELLLQQSASQQGEAEASFHQALDVSRRQQAKSLELRAAMSLARLWQQQGKQAEAQALLAPIYGWFTEGFDTADLQEGKALLEE